MSDTDQAADSEVIHRWLPYLSQQDCEAGLRLAAVMVEAGLMDQTEAAAWSAQLRAWKAAHAMEPAEA